MSGLQHHQRSLQAEFQHLLSSVTSLPCFQFVFPWYFCCSLQGAYHVLSLLISVGAPEAKALSAVAWVNVTGTILQLSLRHDSFQVAFRCRSWNASLKAIEKPHLRTSGNESRCPLKAVLSICRSQRVPWGSQGLQLSSIVFNCQYFLISFWETISVFDVVLSSRAKSRAACHQNIGGQSTSRCLAPLGKERQSLRQLWDGLTLFDREGFQVHSGGLEFEARCSVFTGFTAPPFATSSREGAKASTAIHRSASSPEGVWLWCVTTLF